MNVFILQTTMYTNNLEIIVNAPIQKAWRALTDKEKIREWMSGVEVETNWAEGEPIFYKCFDKRGNVMTWNGRQMVWDGIVEKIIPQKELSYFFPSKATGLEKETYHLVELYPEVTKIILVQECLSKECALGNVDGTRNTLQKLKDFLELRY